MAKLSPLFNEAQFINGIPASGAKIFTYAAGSSTKQTTYTDEDGLVAQSNPIILNSRGEPDNPIWLAEGQSYKMVFAPSTDTDPPTSPIRTIDDVSGVGDNSISLDQWVDSGVTPTYVSATQFTLPGDQTSNFTVKRRVKATVTAGTIYGSISTSAYTSLTTVTVDWDGSSALDSGLSAIQLGLITTDNTSIPSVIEKFRATVAATATTTPLWTSIAEVQDWTGTPTITDFPVAPQPGATRVVYPAAGTVFTDNAVISVQGNTNYTTSAGDKITIVATTTSTFDVKIERETAFDGIMGYEINGLVVTISTVDSDHDLDISAGLCAFSSATGIYKLTSGITKRMDASFAKGTNAGGLGNGLSIPTSGQLFIFAITENSTGDTDVYGDTSVSGANPPTGWTVRRFLSMFKTDSSANLIPVTVNQWSSQLMEHQIITPVRDVNTTTQASGTPTLRSLATSVPVGLRLNVKYRFAIGHGSAGTSVSIQDPLMTGDTPSGTGAPLATGRTSATGGVTEAESTVWTDTSAQVETNASSNNTTIEIVTLSYYFKR